MRSPGAGAADDGQDRPGSSEQASWLPGFTSPVRLAVVDSTNRWLRDAAVAGAPHGTSVLAAEQLAGRGRRERTWSSPPGSAVLCSVLFRSGLGARDAYLAPAVVGLAALDAARSCCGVEASLKWPNDVLVGGRKLGGILSEMIGGPGVLVVGIGLNVGWPPGWPPAGPLAGLAGSATTLERECGRALRREVVEKALLDAISRRARDLDSVGGRARVATQYRGACSTLDRRVRVELDRETLEGRAVGLEDDGRLVVELSDGRRRSLDAGDVVHLR